MAVKLRNGVIDIDKIQIDNAIVTEYLAGLPESRREEAIIKAIGIGVLAVDAETGAWYAMFICASVLSLYIHLRHQGVDVHKYGARYVELSKMRPLPEEEAEGEEDMGEMLAAEKMHPGEFDFEIVQGDGKTFDFGYNVKSCAICHVFSQHDAMDLVPYMCAFDDVASDLGDMGLRRTGTIAVGASHCDFRYKKGREPQHLAEVYPEKIRLLADDKPLYYETHPLVED